MCRGWFWGNLGGDVRAKKQTEKKNVYLVTVAVNTVEKIMGEYKKRREKRKTMKRLGLEYLLNFFL